MREPSTTFLRVIINRIAKMAKSPSYFGTGDLLYFSEVQIIDVMGNNPEINITELLECTPLELDTGIRYNEATGKG